jgi:glucose-6-phosphate isomerase
MDQIREPVNRTSAWRRLEEERASLQPNLREWFDADPERAASLSVKTEHILYDFSRQIVTGQILAALLALAEETHLKENIAAMFSGEKINRTEDRAVLHTALRNLSGDPVHVDGRDVMPEVNHVLEKIEQFSRKVHNGEWTGFTGKRLRNVISIGIGGSQLGPEYLAEACKKFAVEGMTLSFVANVDPTDLARKTESLNPEETLVVVVSKTFTTAETKANARAAKQWITGVMGDEPEIVRKHFVAVSTNEREVRKFGIDPDNMFVFWDWIGGRYSATSAVGGVPLSLSLGYENFRKILEGAQWMDRHFRETPLRQNIPVLAGLLDIWNVNFMGYNTRAIAPYSQAWNRYAAHCQQTEMESNGKSVDLSGRAVEFDTGEIVFGEPGTNGQHSYFQLLHQGTNIVPVDFIGFINPQYRVETAEQFGLHHELMTNFFAQPDALAFGKSDPLPHKTFDGNRPSNIFLLKHQNPFAAGILLALLEHRVAVKGFIWGINSFDQFGVELGKKLGCDLKSRMQLHQSSPGDTAVFDGLNGSTSALLRAFLDGTWQSQAQEPEETPS